MKGEVLPVEGDRQPAFEGQPDRLGRIRGRHRGDRPSVDLFGRLDERILEDPAFDGASPEVLVDAERGFRGRFDRHPVLAGVDHLLLPGHVPFPGGRDHSELRSEAGSGEVEAHLVVPLPRAPVGDVGRALLPGDLDHVAADQRAGESRAERVDSLVERVGLEGRREELFRELLSGVSDVRPDGCRRLPPWRAPVRGRPARPTLTVRATTSNPLFSFSQGIATDVSSPPEYASTTFGGDIPGSCYSHHAGLRIYRM